MDNPYIGRGEKTVELILGRLFYHSHVSSQFLIYDLMTPEDTNFYDDEIKKHRFDFKVSRPYKADLIVEVNYKHKGKADQKWNDIFIPLIHQADMIPVVIEDSHCTSLFKDKSHPINLGDWRDVINELIRSGVEL